ncbi:MAG: hypothetical protein WC575_02450 [Patescibacteria group bacterium]
MSYINNIKFRSFSFYSSNSNFKRNFVSGRNNNETTIVQPTIQPIDCSVFWRNPKGKKNYSLKIAH